MSDIFLAYISATPELVIEREVLGRVVTEIPTSLAWRIVQTPHAGEEPDLEAVANANVHLLLLGDDVRAPIGVEWLAARRAGQRPTLLLKKVKKRTQAAAAFIRELERYAMWQPFNDADDLRHKALRILVQHILTNSDYFSIKQDEYERLSTWLTKIKTEQKQHTETIKGGAGESSVIFSSERYEPSDGVLLRTPEQSQGFQPPLVSKASKAS